MIEPYGTIVNSFLGGFAKIGFSKLQESDYSVTLSRSKSCVEISTEKYYHPTLTTRFLDENGKKFSMRIIREVLAPGQLDKDSIELKAIRKGFHLDDAGIDEALRNQGVAAYVTLAIEQLLHFLTSYEKDLVSGSFKSEYVTREKAALKKIGL